jgi:hypothetical protein
VQAATTKITIIAMTMEVTNTPFRQSMSSRTGKELSYGPYNRNCDACGAGGTALVAIVCQAKITVSLLKRGFLALVFITTWIALSDRPPVRFASFVAREQGQPVMPHSRELLQSAKRAARHRAIQATDSVSRSREEITVETPSPRMLIPYRASAISIVRFW